MGCEHPEGGHVELYKGIAAFIIGMIFIGENVLLLFILLSNKEMKAKYLFTVSLALTDLIVGVSYIAASFYLMPPIMSDEDSASLQYMTIFVIVGWSIVLISTVHMPIIAADRYLYVTYPFFYETHVTRRVILSLIATVWILGAIVFASFTVIQFSVWRKCMNSLDDIEAPIKQLSAIVYGMAAVVTGVFYILILVEVKKHRNAIRCISDRTMATPKWTEAASSIRFFVTVFGLYFMMTCPGFVIIFFVQREATPNWVRFLAATLVTLNSGMNFIILTAVDKQFRHAAKQTIFSCKTCKKGSR